MSMSERWLLISVVFLVALPYWIPVAPVFSKALQPDEQITFVDADTGAILWLSPPQNDVPQLKDRVMALDSNKEYDVVSRELPRTWRYRDEAGLLVDTYVYLREK